MSPSRCTESHRSSPARLCDLFGRILVFVFVLVLATLSAADDPEPGTKDNLEPAGQAKLTIPQVLSDGRPVRTIGLYQSQIDELIPKNFQPIPIDRFVKGIADLGPRMTSEINTRLVSSVYWIDVRDDLMVSRRSEVIIDTDADSIVKHSLGPVNLAMESPTSLDSINGSDQIPRLENRSNGDLVAVFDGRKDPSVKLPFRWQLQGRRSSLGHEFDLRLPRSPQTRIILSVPPKITLEALDGVLRRRSGPPSDAGTLSSNDQSRWYELDAGGLDRVRISSREQRPRNRIDPWIVRDHSVEYQVDKAGLNWICHVRLQAPVEGVFPMFQFRRASVTKVVVNSYDVPFSSVGRGIRRNVRIDPPSEAFRDRSGLTTVSIHGTAPFRANSQWIELPMPRWFGDVEVASTIDQVRMLVPDDLELIKWILPNEWIWELQQRVDGRGLLYTASGPYFYSKSTLSSADQTTSAIPITDRVRTDGDRTDRVRSDWPRVRFARRSVGRSSETTIRIEMAEGSLNAHARLAVKTDHNGLSPLRIRIEPNWKIESISFANSSRVVEQLKANTRGDVYTLWPEPEDIEDGEIVFEIDGNRILDAEVGQLTIPATWFVSVDEMSDDRNIALIRPSALNWASNAVVENEQVSAESLSETAKQFLGVLSSDTLLFRPEFGRSPTISLKRPIASFDAVTQFYVFRDRDEIQENIEIDIESSGKPLQQIGVQAGPSHGRPPLVWSLADHQGTPEIQLPTSAVAIGRNTQDETYSINLADRNLSGHHLIGRRRYPANAEQTLQLPSVPGATSIRSHAWIGPGLSIKQKPPDVHAIMRDPADLTPDFRTLKDASLQSIDLQNAIGLQYGQTPSSSITLAISDRKKEVAIVRDEQIDVVASSRGVDRIEATYQLAPSNQSIRIQYEPNLRLVSMIRNETVVDLDSFAQRFVTIPPRSKSEVVRLTFNRDLYENRWMRSCNIPRISVSGIVLNSDCGLIPASDAFAPVALLRGNQMSSGNYSRIDLQPGDSVTLIRRNVVLASGWLISMLVFALAWIFARRHALILACTCIVFVSALLLWWPWKAAIIGWLIVPVVSAAMLATSRRSYQDNQRLGPLGTSHGPDTAVGPVDGTSDFSIETVFRILPWLIIFIGLTSISLTAEEPTPETAKVQADEQQVPDSMTSGKAINVLVPIAESGKQTGEIVYVDNSVYQQLVSPRDNPAESTASFQSAEYRLRIETDHIDGNKQNQVVEANFLIHLDRDFGNANFVKFPFADSVQRIELRGKLRRLIPFDRDTDNSVIAHLPGGRTFQLRVTLNPQITQSGTWHRLELPIPRVSASRLTIESSSDISQVRVGGSQGTVFSRADRQGWSMPIGPQNLLVIEYPANQKPVSQKKQSLKRKYLVEVGRRIATIDCQLDPPIALSAGNTYQFIVLSNRLPLLVSKRWKLQKQELLGSDRRRFTVESTHDQPGPIQLLWTLPIDVEQAIPTNPTQISIPEVTAADSTQSSGAWVGLRCDPGLQFAPLIGDDIESLSVDHFKAQWQGRQVELDRAYLAISEIPGPIVQLRQRLVSTIRQRHHAHVTSDQLELKFKATLTPANVQTAVHSLTFPSDLRLRSVKIDGQRQPIPLNRFPNHTEVLLRGLGDSKPVQIDASAIVLIPSDGKFVLPSMTVTGALVSADEYLVSRDPTIVMTPTTGALPETETLNGETAADWLRRGWSPSFYWRSNLSDVTGSDVTGTDAQTDNLPRTTHTLTGSQFQIASYPTEFDCRQVLSVDRDDLGWHMQANIHFSTNQMPDVVDVEVPSQWCGSLEVEGALQWIRLGEEDAKRNIIRIRYDKESVARRSLAIRGRLALIDSARMIVPRIQVIGPGQRQVYLDIPNQAVGGEPLAWQMSAVDTIQIPDELSRPDSQVDALKAKHRRTFLATNPSWSIELQTVPDLNSNPIAFLQECNVLSQSNGSLVHCRWDLYPGDLDSVVVRIDHDTTALAAWSAGRAVEILPEDRPSEQANENDAWFRIPLSVSRLAQSVEILLRVSPTANAPDAYIPKLQGIPIERSWLVQNSPSHSTDEHPLSPVAKSFRGSTQESLPMRNSKRLLSLAASIVDSIESIDLGSGQSRPEIAEQLLRWLARFGALRQQADIPSATESIKSEWGKIESRLVLSCQRQGMDPSDVATKIQAGQGNPANSRMSEFENSTFRGFRIDDITAMTMIDQPSIVKRVSSNERGLQTLIANGLTMVLTAGILLCLLPFYEYVAPVTAHPAFWLGLLGIFGFAIVPTYVAAALVLLAIALPVFPVKKRVSEIVG